MRRRLPVSLCVILGLLTGCGKGPSTRPGNATGNTKAVPAKAGTRSGGHPTPPKSLSFTQSGLHNCGTVAMLISWAYTRPGKAAGLVEEHKDGSYWVKTASGQEIIVSPADLKAAEDANTISCKPDDPWSRIVLTAFIKSKSDAGKLDFKAIEWIYAGDIAEFLSGGQSGGFEIKPETVASNGAITVGKPVSLERLNKALTNFKGYPMVAYTNRRVHIWAVLDYDPDQRRILIRNPRKATSEWVALSEFSSRFQLIVVADF